MYLANESPKNIAEKLDIKYSTVQYWIQKDGLPSVKRELKKEKQQIANLAEDEHRDELISNAKELAIKEQKKLADEHYSWQRDSIETAKRRIDEDVDSRAKLSTFLSNTEAIDRLARKTFNIEAGGQVNEAQRQVAIVLQVVPPTNDRLEEVVTVDV